MAASVSRGLVAGLAGTGVMTALEKYIEMPITGRGESYAPASLVEKLLPTGRQRGQKRRRINYVNSLRARRGLIVGRAGGS